MATFQDVKNAPEKQYVDKVNLTVLNIVNANPDQWKNYIQEVLAKDETGAQERLRLQTKFADGLLDNNDLNRTMPFKLKWFTKQGGYGLQGYPLKAKVASPAPPLGPPPQGAQFPQAGREPSLSPPPPAAAKAPDWDAKDERIVRQNTLNRAVELYLALGGVKDWPISTPDFTEICMLAEIFRDYVYKGTGNISPGDQFSKDHNLPTIEEEQAAERQQPAF